MVKKNKKSVRKAKNTKAHGDWLHAEEEIIIAGGGLIVIVMVVLFLF